MTGYVRLDLPNRSHAEYERLGGRLVEVAERAGFPVVVAGGAVDDCWHWPVSDGARLPEGNPDKDTRAFHAVQHQKTAWVADARLARLRHPSRARGDRGGGRRVPGAGLAPGAGDRHGVDLGPAGGAAVAAAGGVALCRRGVRGPGSPRPAMA